MFLVKTAMMALALGMFIGYFFFGWIRLAGLCSHNKPSHCKTLLGLASHSRKAVPGHVIRRTSDSGSVARQSDHCFKLLNSHVSCGIIYHVLLALVAQHAI